SPSVCRERGDDWTVVRWLNLALDMRREGRVLISFDVPLGLPRAYLDAARKEPRWKHAASFLQWLAVGKDPSLFPGEATDASTWSIVTPFFGVPGVRGGLRGFEAAAGIPIRREIERRTSGKSVFIVRGIPGSVGSGARAVWRELAPLLDTDRAFSVWPFEGTLNEIFGRGKIAIGEIYPRAAYATALSHVLPARPRALAKTQRPVRATAVRDLAAMPWVAQRGVRLSDQERAIDNEDDFDAMMTAAALLRVHLEGYPVSDPSLDDPVAEGGILCTGTLDFGLNLRK
ncbi:MAG: hypothetical protein ACYC8T_39035, partial [Myxococcaceae bacterium]